MSDPSGQQRHPSPVIGIIGGSGLYEIDGLEDAEWIDVSSPFGAPSDQLRAGTLEGVRVVFLPRHGRGHRLSPTTIDYRANIDALKRAGVTDVMSLSAVGSLREDLAPGTFVIVDQFVDRTFAREKSFFGTGMVAHVAVGDPVCARLGDAIERAAAALRLPTHRGGSYVAIEGPQFSTRAESMIYRSWGCAVIGMTNMPEAKLAREAELCYATVAMVTDYDTWHTEHADVDAATVVRVLRENAEHARALIREAVPLIAASRLAPCPSGCDRALDGAMITAPEARDPDVLARLDAVAGRVLRGES